jgi:hypothetical protein
MLTTRTYRTPFLLALIVCAAIALTGKTPAFAASCTPGAPDKPDLGFVDSDCDGIDGDKADALFVAPGGSDANDGSFGHPMATVQAAVTAGLAQGKDVYVAAGTYDGKVAVLGGAGHIGIYGGYDPATWARSTSNTTTITASRQVVGIADPGVVLQLLTIHGYVDATTSTSYGVRLWGLATVALSHDVIEPGAGVAGYNGADASQTQPAQAPKGAQGVGNPNCDPDKLKGTFNPGAAGASAPGLLSGGQGGWWFDPLGYPYKGHDGAGDPGVGGGIGGGIGWPGGLGSPGKTGAAGLPGYADLNLASLFFKPMNGTDGGAGTRGAGGGGGGMSSATCIPGSGGGAGGRPGAGGAGGQGGGGSIGVFAGDGGRVLVLDGTVIHAANGGKGGNGGLGQPGGEGGDGGDPGIDIYDQDGGWPGTAGGHGGKGGAGGQGGGAAGGPSLGVLAVDARASVRADTTITVGKGGQNGIGGHNGWQGAAAPVAQVTTSGGSIPAAGDFDGDGIGDESDSCPIAAGPGDGCPPAPVDPSAGPGAGSGSGSGGSGSGSGAAGSAKPGAGSLATVSVLPATKCVAKRLFRIHINARKAHLKSAKLTLDGRKLRLVKGKHRWTARVDLRHSKRARHTLTIRGRLRNGHAYKQTRRYRTC